MIFNWNLQPLFAKPEDPKGRVVREDEAVVPLSSERPVLAPSGEAGQGKKRERQGKKERGGKKGGKVTRPLSPETAKGAESLTSSVLLSPSEVQLYKRLEDKHGFPPQFAKKVLFAARYLLPKDDDQALELPPRDSEAYADVSAFLNHPVVLRQVLTLLNLKILKNGKIVPGAEEALTKLGSKGGGSAFTIEHLLEVLQPQDIDLPDKEKAEIATSGEKRKEFLKQTLKRLHVPDDLSKKGARAFEWFRNEVGIGFLRENIRAISEKAAASIESSDLEPYQKEYLLKYILPLIQMPVAVDQLDPRKMTQYRNTLWTFHTYGLCTVDFKEARAKDGHFIPEASISIEPDAGDIFVKHARVFFSEPDKVDVSRGFSDLTADLLEGNTSLQASVGRVPDPRKEGRFLPADIENPRNLIASLKGRVGRTGSNVPRSVELVTALVRRTRIEQDSAARPSERGPSIDWAALPTESLVDGSYRRLMKGAALLDGERQTLENRLRTFLTLLESLDILARAELPGSGKGRMPENMRPLIKEGYATPAYPLDKKIDLVKAYIQRIESLTALFRDQMDYIRQEKDGAADKAVYPQVVEVIERAYGEIAKGESFAALQANRSLAQQALARYESMRMESRSAKKQEAGGRKERAAGNRQDSYLTRLKQLIRLDLGQEGSIAKPERLARVRAKNSILEKVTGTIGEGKYEISNEALQTISEILKQGVLRDIEKASIDQINDDEYVGDLMRRAQSLTDQIVARFPARKKS